MASEQRTEPWNGNGIFPVAVRSGCDRLRLL